jgi:hypothetical protein
MFCTLWPLIIHFANRAEQDPATELTPLAAGNVSKG